VPRDDQWGERAGPQLSPANPARPVSDRSTASRAETSRRPGRARGPDRRRAAGSVVARKPEAPACKQGRIETVRTPRLQVVTRLASGPLEVSAGEQLVGSPILLPKPVRLSPQLTHLRCTWVGGESLALRLVPRLGSRRAPPPTATGQCVGKHAW
jgi:hypothetical protein